MIVSGFPMDPFDTLWIVCADGQKHHFNSHIAGFEQHHDESLADALLRAAKERFPDTTMLITGEKQ